VVPEAVAVDALGAMRVASLLDNSNAWLRPARAKDAQLWFTWANDSSVRANGFHPDPIPWEEHQAWFERHRQSPDSRLWIGYDTDEQPLGYVRLHRRDGVEWEVGAAVAPERRGQGVGQRLVRLALQAFSRAAEQAPTGDNGQLATRIIARIKPVNSASLKLFQSLGFKPEAARSTPQCCLLARSLRK
jgi:RimJ/RimL family protein N-acetyltransferase